MSTITLCLFQFCYKCNMKLGFGRGNFANFSLLLPQHILCCSGCVFPYTIHHGILILLLLRSVGILRDTSGNLCFKIL